MRQVIGYFLLSLPFIAITLYSIAELGVKETVYAWITTIVLLFIVFTGMSLISS